MPYLILHTATGVVRRVTIDPDHAIGADESRVEIADNPDWTGGRPKYVAGVLSKATAAEIEEADKIPYPPEILAIRQAAAALLQDPTVPQTVKDFVLALRVIFRQSRVGLK